MKRPSRFFALTLVLLLGIGGGLGTLRSDSRVYAQVPTDSDAASIGLSGTFAGLADYATVSGVFAVTGVAAATTGNAVSVEVYLDGKYARTVLQGADTPQLSYSCTLDPALLDAGLHRVEAVAFGDDGTRLRIGGAWFTAVPLVAAASLDGLPAGGVLSADAHLVAHLVAASTPLASVEVRLDGETASARSVSPATRRPEVSFDVRRAGLSTGRHVLTLVATDTAGTDRVVLETVLQVPRGGGALDQRLDVALSGRTTISGFVLHGADYPTVEAWMDRTDAAGTVTSTKVWSGAATRDRTEAALGADVLAASPRGFAFSLDTAPFPDGAYTLRVQAVPASGSAVVVEQRAVFVDNADGVVNADGVNVRNLPTTLSPSAILVKLPVGSVVDVLDAEKGNEAISGKGTTWYRVRFTYNGVLYGTDAAPCYIYGYYVSSDPTMRANTLSSVEFTGMVPYNGFSYNKTDFSSVIAHDTDRISIARLYRYPGAAAPTLTVDDVAVSDLYAPVLLAPGSHVIVLTVPADATNPSRSYTFRVLRLAEQSGTVNGSPTNLRQTATSTGTLLKALAKGTAVIVKATVTGEYVASYKTDQWYLVRYPYTENGVDKVLEGYIISPLVTLTKSESDDPFYLNLAAFPTSYHAALWDIHLRHPAWTIEPLITGLSWNTALAAESQAGAHRNLTPWYSNKSNDFYNMVSPDYVAGGAPPTYIGSGFYIWDSTNWVAASKKMIAYYLDPRNFLSDGHIFQFEKLAYNASSQTLAGIDNILSGSYMGNGRTFPYKAADGSTQTMNYAQAFLQAASTAGVSPFHLASKSRMEVSTSSAQTGTVQSAPDSTHVALPTSANPNDDFYKGFTIRITSGTGSGLVRTISGYAGATRTATVSAWSTIPDATSTYSIAGPFLISSALGTLGLGSSVALNQYYLCKVLPPHTDFQVQDPAYPDDPTKVLYVHYYAGYFNFYNIGAYPNPSVEYGAQKNAVLYAQWGGSYEGPEILTSTETGTLTLPWTDALRAIVGGAQYIRTQYIDVGQNTMYLEKFDVVGPSYYGHQYVQNVQAADDEGLKYYYAYLASGTLDTAITFRIPVYDDMPDALSPQPK